MMTSTISELNRLSKLVQKNVLSIAFDSAKDNVVFKKRIRFSVDDIGFKLRPYLVFSGAALGDVKETTALPFATAVEFLQLSTLVIDDILDSSVKRNKKESCYKKFGTKESILIGEHLHNVAYNLINSTRNMVQPNKIIDALSLLNDSYHSVTVGQFNDLQSSTSQVLTEKEYFDLINLTTGVFIKNSLLIGASLTELPESDLEKLKSYGYFLGLAYQLRDDIIDIIGSAKFTGKPELIDIENRRFRLPIIFLLTKGDKVAKKKFATILEKNKLSANDKAQILKIIIESSAIDYSIRKTKNLCEQARKSIFDLPDSFVKEQLFELPNIISNFEK